MGSGSVEQITIENVSTSTTNELDQQANNFALELLIPRKTLAAYMQNFGLEDVHLAAEMFAVAPFAMQKVMSTIEVNYYVSSSPQKKQSGWEEDVLEIAGAVISAKFGIF
jgi:Zn-dependent peptidase ImmA (M78 family)